MKTNEKHLKVFINLKYDYQVKGQRIMQNKQSDDTVTNITWCAWPVESPTDAFS